MEDKDKLDFKLDSIEDALSDLKKGKLIIVVDDEDRENEGDFVAIADLVSPETINYMAQYGRGLICVSLPSERCDELGLGLMVQDNTVLHKTQFTVSVDLIGNGCTTGISAFDRAKTIKALVDKSTKPQDFGKPGHIFPLRAKKGGVLRRKGHTEASSDLAKLSGYESSAGILVEILNEDGSMARLPQLYKIAKANDFKIISIEDLINFRLKSDSLVIEKIEVDLPTNYGNFKLKYFKEKYTNKEHLAIVKGELNKDKPTLVRLHSSCITGDIFGSCRCDCGPQLHEAMKMIEKNGNGVILYLFQEGRGIGLFNKLKAYKLQESGLDTVEANIQLGFKDDLRDYGIGAQILNKLGLEKIILISNNPRKINGLIDYGIEIHDRISLKIDKNIHNEKYLNTKKNKMDHDL